jgi:predicted AAA+ superfamily ATPase
MQGYIDRYISADLMADLALFPAVALIGPRQCGKSRLAAKIAESYPGSLRLDMENPRDRAKLADPLLYLEANSSRFVCIDEIQLVPELFPILRSEIDRDRRPGRFLILGSASRALVNRSAESLAGRIGYRELTPFMPTEYLPGSPPSVLEALSRGGPRISPDREGRGQSQVARKLSQKHRRTGLAHARIENPIRGDGEVPDHVRSSTGASITFHLSRLVRFFSIPLSA